MLLSLVCAALASTAAVFAALLSVMDSSHRLRSDKLLIRHGRESGVAHWLQSQSVKASFMKLTHPWHMMVHSYNLQLLTKQPQAV